ncbi:serine hydrolase domain-containing protein [Microbacterium sp. NPDC056569]|uniref:serine hydrolase domain-containing protein n=1 Tax=Microbacterium sp. NPDC056569 TaxID=3345867 RepID=UPI00366C46DE
MDLTGAVRRQPLRVGPRWSHVLGVRVGRPGMSAPDAGWVIGSPRQARRMVASGVWGRSWLITPVALALVLSGCTPDPLDQKRSASAEVLEAVVPDDEPGCSAAVAIDGDVVWAQARGLADVDTGAPLETSTPIHIASVGKQFTAMAVLMLAEQGALSVEDSPADHLDGLPPWTEDLTLNDLMHHTSGIAEFLEVPLSDFGPPPLNNGDILEFVRTSPNAQPGTPGTWSYSNTNYTLLADIIAEVTGVEFDEWMQANVFTPLELEARIGPQTPSDPIGYEAVGEGFLVAEPFVWDVVGPGFVTMTPSELARWGDQLRAPSLVSDDTLDDALSDGVPVGDGWSYGPGLLVAEDGTLVHDGAGAGHETNFGVSDDRHTTIAISCNHDGLHLPTVLEDLAAVWID